jgi:hypothetical protein
MGGGHRRAPAALRPNSGPFGLMEQLSRFGLPLGVVFVAAFAMTWMMLDRWSAGDLAAEGRAISQRAFDLNMRALTPGSPLACLDGTAGETVQDACERALFATPESTAGAVSYVSAQLALLAAGRQHAQVSGSSYANALTTVRRAVEADRFGIAGYLFATRPGCQAGKCDLFDLLKDPARVSANIAKGTFDSYVRAHMAEWASAGSRPVASNLVPDAGSPGVPAAAPAAKPASNLFFPSSSSIPPVNIMANEPASPQQTHEAGAVADAATRPRKQPQVASPTRQPASADAGQVRSGPLQIFPPAQ